MSRKIGALFSVEKIDILFFIKILPMFLPKIGGKLAFSGVLAPNSHFWHLGPAQKGANHPGFVRFSLSKFTLEHSLGVKRAIS